MVVNFPIYKNSVLSLGLVQVEGTKYYSKSNMNNLHQHTEDSPYKISQIDCLQIVCMSHH